MPATYEKIATTTLGSATPSITFSSIAASWTDLRLVFVGIATNPYEFKLEFNGSAGTAYSRTLLGGNGTSAYSGRSTSAAYIAAGDCSDTQQFMVEIDIFSYAGSTNKTVLATSSNDRNGSGLVLKSVGLWRNTAAITQVKITADSANFSIGSTATLYGILKA